MTSPCPRCERELRPAALEAGARCRRCTTLTFDESLRVLLDGIRPSRRSRWRPA